MLLFFIINSFKKYLIRDLLIEKIYHKLYFLQKLIRKLFTRISSGKDSLNYAAVYNKLT